MHRRTFRTTIAAGAVGIAAAIGLAAPSFAVDMVAEGVAANRGQCSEQILLLQFLSTSVFCDPSDGAGLQEVEARVGCELSIGE